MTDYAPSYGPVDFGPLAHRPAATDVGRMLWVDETGAIWASDGASWIQAQSGTYASLAGPNAISDSTNRRYGLKWQANPATAHSGSHGLWLIRENPSDGIITLVLAEGPLDNPSPVYDCVALDTTTRDIVLSYSHKTHSDQFRGNEDGKWQISESVTSPSAAYRFEIQGEATEKTRNGLDVLLHFNVATDWGGSSFFQGHIAGKTPSTLVCTLTTLGQMGLGKGWSGLLTRDVVTADGTTTSGSPTLGSATAFFKSTDVGKTVSGAGIPGGTTITAVAANHLTATMSANATATASGVAFTIAARGVGNLEVDRGALVTADSADPLLQLARTTDLAQKFTWGIDSSGTVYLEDTTRGVGTNVLAVTTTGLVTMPDTRLVAVATADESVIDDGGGVVGLALINDAELTRPVKANSTYLVEAFIRYDASQTGDFKLGFNFPSGSTFVWAAAGEASTITSSTGNVNDVAPSGTSSQTYGGNGAGNAFGILVRGTLKTSSTAGSFLVRHAQGTADAVVASRRLANSHMILERVA